MHSTGSYGQKPFVILTVKTGQTGRMPRLVTAKSDLNLQDMQSPKCWFLYAAASISLKINTMSQSLLILIPDQFHDSCRSSGNNGCLVT